MINSKPFMLCRLGPEGEFYKIVCLLERLCNPPTGKIPFHAFVLGYEKGRNCFPIEQTRRKYIKGIIESGTYLVKGVSFSKKLFPFKN